MFIIHAFDIDQWDRFPTGVQMDIYKPCHKYFSKVIYMKEISYKIDIHVKFRCSACEKC